MLILLRHGESTGNAEGRLLGHLDAPLTDRGRAQVHEVRAACASVTRMVTSPLSRARETAECLGLDVPIEVDERWIEVDYGALDGRKLREVPDDVWVTWRRDPTFTPPGGESLADAGGRVRSACEELFAAMGADGDGRVGGGDVLVVSHVTPIKAALCWALGGDDAMAWRIYLATASISRIGRGHDGPVVRSINEVLYGATAPGESAS